MEGDFALAENLRACLDQPGPSWLGDFVEQEIVAVEIAKKKGKAKEQRMKCSDPDIVKENFIICQDIIVHLAENVVNACDSIQNQYEDEINDDDFVCTTVL